MAVRFANLLFTLKSNDPDSDLAATASWVRNSRVKNNRAKVFDLNSKDLAAVETRAIALVEGLVWPDGPVCPHCGHDGKIYRLSGRTTRPGLCKCAACRKQFTVRVGTIFEGSHIPMSKWLIAIYMMCTYPKGVSASQLQRTLDISYKSAWFLCQRVRYAKEQRPLCDLLSAGS